MRVDFFFAFNRNPNNMDGLHYVSTYVHMLNKGEPCPLKELTYKYSAPRLYRPRLNGHPA